MEMRQLSLALLLIVLPNLATAAAPTRGFNYVAHTTIDPAQNNANENALYAYLQAGVDTYASGSLTNDAVSGSAAISYSKLNLIGSIKNADIVALAGIPASKLDLTSPGSIGSTSPGTGKFTTLQATGNVGIGTTIINAGRLLIAGGNVGIGTTHPNVALDVIGQVRPSTGLLFSDGTTQTTAPASLSNVIFQWVGSLDPAASTGIVENASSSSTTAGNIYVYQMAGQSLAGNTIVLRSKWKKISGVNTVTVYANAWQKATTAPAAVQMDIGGVNGSVSGISATAPGTWVNFTVDVSGLVNNTVYDLTVGLSNPTSSGGDGSYAYLGSIVAFGS